MSFILISNLSIKVRFLVGVVAKNRSFDFIALSLLAKYNCAICVVVLFFMKDDVWQICDVRYSVLKCVSKKSYTILKFSNGAICAPFNLMCE